MSKSKSMHVYGQKYRLKRLKSLNKRGLDGELDKELRTISIDHSLEGNEYMEAIIHELGHAIFHECSLYQSISPDLEEVIVDLMAKAIVKNFKIEHK